MDGLLFILGYYLSLYGLVYRLHKPPTPRLEWFCEAAWIFLFVCYEAFLSSGGRATLGKVFLGIRVANLEGGPLSLARGFLRAMGYFLSILFFNLGYVWAFFHPGRRAWHDFLAGSQVLRRRPKSVADRLGILLLSWAVFGALAGLWVKKFMGLSPQDRELVERARAGLEGVARLEEAHRRQFGFYSDDIGRLARMTGDVAGFKSEILNYVAPDDFELSSDRNHYTISAHAKNSRRTRVTLSGP